MARDLKFLNLGRGGIVLSKQQKTETLISFGVTGFRKRRYCITQIAKTKTLISFATTDKLICACVLAYAKIRFSQNEDQIRKHLNDHMSRDVRKPDFCKCENKDADQLRGNREADQRLCFRHLDSTISLPPKFKISSF